MATVTAPAQLSLECNESPVGIVERHRFSVAQYREMIEHGIFAEDEPIELIRGEVVKKMPIGNAHAAMVNQLNRFFSARLSSDLLISIQNPIATEDSEPEPDVAILNFQDDLYASRRPVAGDVRLLIEVADSDVCSSDLIKGSVYAAAGVVEYWIVNLNNSTVEIYLDPQAVEGRYATVNTVSGDQTLQPRAIPGLSLTAEEFFGKKLPS